MAASPQAVATLIQPTKVGVSSSRTSLHLRSSQSVSKSFGFDSSNARLTCSLQTDLKDLTQKCADAAKLAGFALATSALLASGASAEGVPKRLTFDEIQSKTYMELNAMIEGTVYFLQRINSQHTIIQFTTYNVQPTMCSLLPTTHKLPTYNHTVYHLQCTTYHVQFTSYNA
ncbi:hypothetical protein ACHQM5_029947 [Ranunculus cassubicifolius]